MRHSAESKNRHKIEGVLVTDKAAVSLELCRRTNLKVKLSPPFAGWQHWRPSVGFQPAPASALARSAPVGPYQYAHSQTRCSETEKGAINKTGRCHVVLCTISRLCILPQCWLWLWHFWHSPPPSAGLTSTREEQQAEWTNLCNRQLTLETNFLCWSWL